MQRAPGMDEQEVCDPEKRGAGLGEFTTIHMKGLSSLSFQKRDQAVRQEGQVPLITKLTEVG